MAGEEQSDKHSWPPTARLVEEVQAGNTAALETFFHLVRPRLRAFLLYQGFTPEACDELSSIVVATVLQKISTLKNAQAFEAWFWTVARNHVRGYMRKQKRTRRLNELPGPGPAQPDEIVLLAEEYQAVRSALATLSLADRELLWLREVERLSYREIGSRLGVATGAIRVRGHRARRRLQAAYQAVIGWDKQGRNDD
jgi:RNA polymerase sigma-70 factor (ECF subfamily)